MDAQNNNNNNIDISAFIVPGGKATNYVLGVGIFTVLLLLACDSYYIVKDIHELDYKEVQPDENEFILVLTFKIFFFVLFPLYAFVGIILTFLLRYHPSLINRCCCQPVLFLLPSVFPLGYHWIMSTFQMVNSLTVLADGFLKGYPWALVLIFTTKFLLLLFALSMYYVLIQVAYGQYKIARELNSRRPLNASSQTQPLQPPPSSSNIPSVNNNQQNFEADFINDSSETPFNV